MWQKAAKSTEEPSTPDKALDLTTAGEGSHRGLPTPLPPQRGNLFYGLHTLGPGAEGKP